MNPKWLIQFDDKLPKVYGFLLIMTFVHGYCQWQRYVLMCFVCGLLLYILVFIEVIIFLLITFLLYMCYIGPIGNSSYVFV